MTDSNGSTGRKFHPTHTERVAIPGHVTAKVEMVTTQMASTWLGTMDPKRPARRRKINAFAREMTLGQWHVNGEPIIFDNAGKLVDGQHRLEALLVANVTVPMLIVRGVYASSVVTIDTGSSRSYGDAVILRSGGSNGNSIAAIARRWWLYENTEDMHSFKTVLTHQEIDHILEQHPVIFDAAERVRKSSFRRYLPGANYGFVYGWLSEKQDIGIADLFFDLLETGAELKVNDPVFLLRRRLVETTVEPSSLEALALTIKAYNFWMQGQKIEVLSWRKGEAFPRFGEPSKAALATRARRTRRSTTSTS